MKYEVRCECGKARAVSASDAGVSLRCDCGRAVEVPALHRLRAAVGEPVLSPAVRIEALLLEGLLPGTRACARCQRDTDGLVRVAVTCERGRMSAAPGTPREQAASGCLVGLLVGALVGVLPGLIVANKVSHPTESEGPKQLGQDVAFTLPLPLCVGCCPNRNESTVLGSLLCSVPDYAALLARYPGAEMTVVG